MTEKSTCLLSILTGLLHPELLTFLSTIGFGIRSDYANSAGIYRKPQGSPLHRSDLSPGLSTLHPRSQVTGAAAIPRHPQGSPLRRRDLLYAAAISLRGAGSLRPLIGPHLLMSSRWGLLECIGQCINFCFSDWVCLQQWRQAHVHIFHTQSYFNIYIYQTLFISCTYILQYILPHIFRIL